MSKWANHLVILSKLLYRSQKTNDSLKFFAHSLFFNERCERVAQGAHQKWAIWANCSGRSPKMSDHEQKTGVAHQKWANSSFFSKWLICSFFCKKQVILSENWWANSQPCWSQAGDLSQTATPEALTLEQTISSWQTSRRLVNYSTVD